MRRIVAEAAPRYVFAENPSKKAIDCAADDLEKMGYETRCIPLSARDLGYDHIRKRYWLCAYTDNESKFHRAINDEVGIVQELQNHFLGSDPEDLRASDGLADRVERLKAIGNGQVPIVAYTAWRLMMATSNPVK